MRGNIIAIATALALFAVSAAAAAEVRTVPGDTIILNSVNPDKGLSDLVVHAVAVATAPGETLTLTGLRIELMAQDRAVLKREIATDEMVRETKRLAGAPIPEFISGQLLNTQSLDGFVGRHVAFAQSATLDPSEALIATRLYFGVDFAPDTVRFTAFLRDSKGKTETATASVPVQIYKPAVAYRMPLSGQWQMQAVPGPQSHHRFNPCTEFAVDFFKLGPDGHVARGDGYNAADFYGYGAPVMAAADGTVAFVIADQVQNRDAFFQKKGES